MKSLKKKWPGFQTTFKLSTVLWSVTGAAERQPAS
jgi:hypothetical protein